MMENIQIIYDFVDNKGLAELKQIFTVIRECKNKRASHEIKDRPGGIGQIQAGAYLLKALYIIKIINSTEKNKKSPFCKSPGQLVRPLKQTDIPTDRRRKNHNAKRRNCPEPVNVRSIRRVGRCVGHASDEKRYASPKTRRKIVSTCLK